MRVESEGTVELEGVYLEGEAGEAEEVAEGDGTGEFEAGEVDGEAGAAQVEVGDETGEATEDG